MKVTQAQLLVLLASGRSSGVWILDEDCSTRIVDEPTAAELAALRSSEEWPMYIGRVDMVENYIREHGLDGTLAWLNFCLALVPEPKVNLFQLTKQAAKTAYTAIRGK